MGLKFACFFLSVCHPLPRSSGTAATFTLWILSFSNHKAICPIWITHRYNRLQTPSHFTFLFPPKIQFSLQNDQHPTSEVNQLGEFISTFCVPKHKKKKRKDLLPHHYFVSRCMYVLHFFVCVPSLSAEQNIEVFKASRCDYDCVG